MSGAIYNAPVHGAALVRLPCGLWRDGAHADEVWLAPLSPGDELRFADLHPSLPPAQWAARLLACLLPQLSVSDLTMGDRDALLLHTYALNYHRDIRCTCPCPDCAQLLEFDLRIDELLLSPHARRSAGHSALIADGERGSWQVKFRLPTVSDIDAVLEKCRELSRPAGRLLVERCLLEVASDGEGVPGELSDGALAKIADLIADLDSQAELRIRLRCVSCAREFEQVIDPVELLARAVKSGARRTTVEIHRLASAYRWSEAEILALPAPRRRRYVDIVEREIAQGRAR